MRTRTPINASQVVITCKCDRSSMMTVRPAVPKDRINYCRVFCGIVKPPKIATP